MARLPGLAVAGIVAAFAVQLAISASCLAQSAQPEPKLKINQGAGLAAVKGTPEHPNIEVECSKGAAVSVELLPTADGVTWLAPGCVCAETVEAAKTAILDQLKRGIWGNFIGGDLKREMKLKSGETQELRLYCYSVNEMRERYKD